MMALYREATAEEESRQLCSVGRSLAGAGESSAVGLSYVEVLLSRS
jgi:hypothetical protein